MTYKVERLADIRDSERQYEAIIARLLDTVAIYKPVFPQLAAIEAFLDSTFTEINPRVDYLEKLQDLCLYFQELSINCYIFRHLYHNFCIDVEAIKNGTPPFNFEYTYIVLPK